MQERSYLRAVILMGDVVADPCIRFEHSAQPFVGRGSSAAAQHGEMVEMPGDLLRVPGDEDRLDIREVLVEGRSADPTVLGDLRHGHRSQPVLGDQGDGVLQDGVAHLVAVRLDRLRPQLRHVTQYTRSKQIIHSDLTKTVCLDKMWTMDDDQTPPEPARLERLVGQADKMVEAGRLSADEAGRLKAAPDPGRAEAVLRDVRARHAGERLDVAVAEGAMTRAEADEVLERVRGGEHSRKLRSHLAQFRPRMRSKDKSGPASADPGVGEGRPA